MEKSASIRILIEPEVKLAIKAKLKGTGAGMSWLIRELLKDWLEKA